MLLALLTSLLLGQDPTPPAPPAPPAPQKEPAVPAEPKRPVLAWDDRQAKAAVDEFNKAMKGSPSIRDRSKALEGLESGSHKLLLKPLVQVIENDKAVLIRKRAAELLGNQPAADANPVIRRLLKSPKASQPSVQAELVRALSRCGYQKQHWAEIDNLFEREYGADRVLLQEALLQLIETHKEKQALPLLLRNLDEPAPVDVDAPDNPPAAYWEARWKAWAVWRGKVKDALFAITGQRFGTAAEAKEWLKQNPLK
ncbi:MAG: hypothetical protein FJ265_03825 [Planctomycetes bacterium]|nr:hypothetical protein [Planctomycetota bacterium]